MIQNIIFDIGNVLVDFCWQEHIAKFGFTGETAKRLGEAMMLHPVWNELDRGVWNNEQLLQGFIKNDPELEAQIRLVFSDLSSLVREREGTNKWLCTLKKAGYKVYYLSNFSARVKTEASRQLTFLHEMDGGVMSYTVQLIKPEPYIYEVLLNRYKLNAKECVFLDDSRANVDTAKRMGMQGIVVESQEQAIKDLDRLLKEQRI